MKSRNVAPMRIAKIGYIALSVCFCAFGLLLILKPTVSTLMIGRMLGIALILFGAVKLVGYFSRDLYRLAFQYDLQFGILMLVLGVILLVRPMEALSYLCIACGLSVLIDGLFRIKISFEAKRFGIGAWWAIAALALLTVLTGVLLVVRPRESTRMLTVLLGVSLLSEGIMNFLIAISTVAIVKHQKPDEIEVENDPDHRNGR